MSNRIAKIASKYIYQYGYPTRSQAAQIAQDLANGKVKLNGTTTMLEAQEAMRLVFSTAYVTNPTRYDQDIPYTVEESRELVNSPRMKDSDVTSLIAQYAGETSEYATNLNNRNAGMEQSTENQPNAPIPNQEMDTSLLQTDTGLSISEQTAQQADMSHMQRSPSGRAYQRVAGEQVFARDEPAPITGHVTALQSGGNGGQYRGGRLGQNTYSRDSRKMQASPVKGSMSSTDGS